MRTIRERESERAERRRVRQLVRAAMRWPYRRERPRDPDEAAVLRELGTPEHLIGPVRDEPSDKLSQGRSQPLT